MPIVCPLTGRGPVQLIKTIPSSEIIALYLELFDVDVSRCFDGYHSIKLFRCPETDYQFFYPFDLSGDSSFYEDLAMRLDWYYTPWKWEHEEVRRLIKGGMKLLEVGCGNGDFLQKVAGECSIRATGLEINSSALVKAQSKGLDVRNQTIKQHADQHQGEYDMACSFQVLEHISEAKSFLAAQIQSLKKGGVLVISVPNNDSFIRYDKRGALNMPPHHMGLWNEHSLRQLAGLFDLRVKAMIKEPLQNNQLEWYQHVIEDHYLGPDVFRTVYYKTRLNRVTRKLIHVFQNRIWGQTIVGVYQK